MHKILLLGALLLGLTSFLPASADKLTKFGYNAIDGSTQDISTMKGKVVVIYFWATWSAPSREPIPVLLKAYKKYKNQGFEILGISIDEDENALKTYVDEYNMNWPEYFDGKGTNNQLYTEMHIKSIPTLWIVGKDGTVLTMDPGKDLASDIDKAMKMPYKP